MPTMAIASALLVGHTVDPHPATAPLVDHMVDLYPTMLLAQPTVKPNVLLRMRTHACLVIVS